MYTGKRRAVNWERTRAEGRKSEDAIEGKVEVRKEQKVLLTGSAHETPTNATAPKGRAPLQLFRRVDDGKITLGAIMMASNALGPCDRVQI